jgi:TetR/AcrR family transcriptional regulator, regulator of mycofactocin system
MEAAVTLRQRHADRTRAAIVSAALELFRERGFQGTTVDDIAQRADVGPRTFFRYFPTKEAVLFADAVAQRERMTKDLEARPPDEHPFLSLTAAAGVLADEIAARGDDIKLRSRIAAENPAVWAYERTMLEADLAETLAGFVAERLGVSANVDPRPRVWAALVMSTFRIAFHLWLDGGQKGQLREGVQRALAAAGEATATLRPPAQTA